MDRRNVFKIGVVGLVGGLFGRMPQVTEAKEELVIPVAYPQEHVVENNQVTIPVVTYKQEEVIGTLTLDESAIPEGVAFSFAPSFKIERRSYTDDGITHYHGARMYEVIMTPDNKVQIINNQGKLVPALQ